VNYHKSEELKKKEFYLQSIVLFLENKIGSCYNSIWPYSCSILNVKWSTRYFKNVQQWTREKETTTIRLTSGMSSTLFCWRFRLNTLLFFFLYRSTHMYKHKIFCPNIHWPPYQLYEHARDYYHLKWCNRDDNCWTNKYTHTLKHYQTGSVVNKTKIQ